MWSLKVMMLKTTQKIEELLLYWGLKWFLVFAKKFQKSLMDFFSWTSAHSKANFFHPFNEPQDFVRFWK